MKAILEHLIWIKKEYGLVERFKNSAKVYIVIFTIAITYLTLLVLWVLSVQPVMLMNHLWVMSPICLILLGLFPPFNELYETIFWKWDEKGDVKDYIFGKDDKNE